MKAWFARRWLSADKAPLPEYAPPTAKSSLVMSILAFMATVLRILIKLAVLSILFVVALITAIIWGR